MVTETSLNRWLEEAALSRRWFDVIIFAGGKQYKAHKIILSSASPFLRGILLSRSLDDLSTIVLADVSSEIVELFLQYVYTGEVSILQEQIDSFIALAKVLQLHVDNNVICEKKYKRCETDSIVVNLPHTNNSVLLNILSEVRTIQKDPDKDSYKKENLLLYEKNANKDIDLNVLIKSNEKATGSMNDGVKNFAIGQKALYPVNNEYPRINEFYKKMQYFGRSYYEDKLKHEVRDAKVVSSLNRVDDDCRSPSSCEVVETTNGDVVSQNYNKYGVSCCEKDRYEYTQQNPYKSSSISPNNCAPLNLIHDPQRSPDSQSNLPNYPKEIGPYENTKNGSYGVHYRDEQIQRPEYCKLIKPIPSLMPIDKLALGETHLRRTPPAVLDLSLVRRKLNRNVNSAFQEVSKQTINNSSYSEKPNYPYYNKSSTGSDYNIHSFISTNRPVSYENTIVTNDRIVPQELQTKSKILPKNRAISGPWCTKSPTFYKPGRMCLLSPQKNTQEISNLHRISTNDEQNSAQSTYTPVAEKSFRNISEVSNDSNNNFDIYNCNNVSANKPFYHPVIERDDSVLEDIHNKQIVLNSPRSISVSSSKDDELYRIPDDDYRNGVDIRNTDLYHKPIDSFANTQNVIIDSELDAVKTEGCVNVLNECEVLKCEFCSKVFTSKESLAFHSGSHSSRARYKCDECDKCFSQLRNYKYHVSVHRGTKEFAATCNVCGKYFNDRGYLSSHMKIHRNRKEYQCPHCPKSFNQRVAYNMHVRIHTGIKPHQCEECGKAFSRKMLLKQHARTHSGEKPYACSSCGKRFADRSNMTLHMRLHSGVKPFSCSLCPKSFTKKHHLKTHLNYHTGNKPYACVKCGLTFSQSSNMRTHMKKCALPDPTKATDVQQHNMGEIELVTVT